MIDLTTVPRNINLYISILSYWAFNLSCLAFILSYCACIISCHVFILSYCACILPYRTFILSCCACIISCHAFILSHHVCVLSGILSLKLFIRFCVYRVSRFPFISFCVYHMIQNTSACHARTMKNLEISYIILLLLGY